MITEADVPKPRSGSPEKGPEVPSRYVGTAEGIKAVAEAGVRGEALVDVINSDLLGRVLQDAQEGRLTKQVKAPDGTPITVQYSPDDIIRQLKGFSGAHDLSYKAKDPEECFRSIPRAGGLRATILDMFKNPDLQEPFKIALMKRENEMREAAAAAARPKDATQAEVSAAQRVVSSLEGGERIADSLRAKEELGGEAVEQVVAGPEEKPGISPESSEVDALKHREAEILAEMNRMVDHLSESDQLKLWSFAIALDNEVPTFLSRLSPEARSIDIFAYRDLRVQLTGVRDKLRALQQ